MKLADALKVNFFSKALVRNNGIARKIMLAVVLFSSAVTAVITAVELYLDYRGDIRGIHERVESIRKVYLPTLVESVWVLEPTQIQNHLNGLMNLGDIEYVGIVSDGKTQWSAGARSSKRQIETVFPLNRASSGESVLIGELQVVASVDNVVSRLWSKFMVMLVSNAIKTFLVTAFVLLIFQALVGQHLEHIAGYLRQFSKNVSSEQALQLNRSEDGRWRPDALDHVANAVNQMRDEIMRSGAKLKASNQRLESMVKNSPLAIYTSDLNYIVSSWNPAAQRMFGWTAEEAIGQKVLFIPKDKVQEYEHIASRLRNGESLNQVELVRQRRDGSVIHISLSTAPLLTTDGQPYDYLFLVADITERKLAEQQIQFQAFHDALTGLPNRLLLQDRFEQAKAHASRANQRLMLLFLDLDNFKSINDTLGHDSGDAFLQQIATRLGACLRETDTISRLGGDEFLILLPDLAQVDDAAPLLAKLMEQMQLPFDAAGHEISTSVSMGVTIFPDDGTSFESLLKKADMAMYKAKSDGRNTYRFFDDAMDVEAVEHQFIRNGLRRALERNEFVLHYQPQMDLASGAIIGVEALIRWNHPQLGMVSPARFIPVSEECGLIVPIGDWVLREACRQAVAWQRAGLPELCMAVNLSAVQFKRGSVEQSVAQALEETRLDPALLELELTESILIQNVEGVLDCVKRLKLLGVKLSIDDFGTGYSSLSYLKRFDIDKLKIDQSFVRDLGTDPDDAAIVRAIIQMARSLNLRTIAEGVETADMLHQLRAFGCDEAQGYYFARPMSTDDIASYLRRQAKTAEVWPAI
ncbi:PAS domain S-box-containing protein/diguanylate cyclase (GGDEF) domain-containing protein [Rhodoferax sp. OV413]|uniref:bifunctional diguanylate cyclase/phosphodiesterase n=1 Tax=Rhodoferax sp. OV413 TaxID=1855285 RepID=UPI000881151D|nr:EAL domain-containing protein [Rhodoferax sp. OV413]SDP72985.1 PAS domain S-box-containing protein/diguanylate cyclase (GGDEF) domain-containing protein [Rhodoferax sp. OV413]